MKLAVVIVNYNSGSLLARCLEKVALQSFMPDEVIVIDNASEDNSLANLPSLDGLRVIKMERNIGFAAANNRAFEYLPDYDYIALLNPDAFPDDNWLKNLMTAADQYPDYAGFASRMLNAQAPEIYDGAGDTYHLSGLAWRTLHGRQVIAAEEVVKEVFSPCAGAALYKAECLFKLGGFDEHFFCYMEDVDLGFRMQLSGNKTLYVPDAIVYHIGSAITGRNSDFSIYYGHRNMVWVYFKNMPWPLLLLSLPAHIVLNLVTIVFFMLKGRIKVILKSKWDALVGLPDIWKSRERVQKQIKVSSFYLWGIMAKQFKRS